MIDRQHYPFCAKCNTPVERVESYRDETQGACGGVVFTVYCHGQKETALLTDLDIQEVKFFGGGISILPVFQEKLSENKGV